MLEYLFKHKATSKILKLYIDGSVDEYSDFQLMQKIREPWQLIQRALIAMTSLGILTERCENGIFYYRKNPDSKIYDLVKKLDWEISSSILDKK